MFEDERQQEFDFLEEEYKQTSKEFSISGYEMRTLDDWTKSHEKICRKRSYSYTFTPTGIGTAVTVRCECGEKQNITDYASW